MTEADDQPDQSAPSADISVEVFVEPFREAAPGPHVTAALAALDNAGLTTDLGAFATAAIGDLSAVADSLPGLVTSAIRAGATQITVRIGGETGEPPRENLHQALERMVATIEAELGAPLNDLSRGDKQAAVRLLHDQGAFLLRRSVDDVAALMSVSRITIYNYLNAIDT